MPIYAVFSVQCCQLHVQLVDRLGEKDYCIAFGHTFIVVTATTHMQ